MLLRPDTQRADASSLCPLIVQKWQLRFPREHWIPIRHSNFIERTFGETRRRVKVIGHLSGKHSCVSLVWAVLDRASAGWRGFAITPAGLRLLADLRHTLHDPPTHLRQPNPAHHAEKPR
ncbi:MAG: transposase [Mycobacterium sp.]